MANLSTVFTGIRFENPFLLASAPPTESESNIRRAFEAGWGGVVTKTIGLHPVANVAGPRTAFLRVDNGGTRLSMRKRPDSTLMASWNWELISDKPLDWWVPRLSAIKREYPDRVVVASIMAGSGNDKELHHWQTLTEAVQDAGADAIELNFSCPHMDRVDMGANVGKDPVLCSVSTQAVKAVARVPVWVKLTPATADIVEEAAATFLGGADAISTSNTFPSLPPIDPVTLDFEVNVDGYASSGGGRRKSRSLPRASRIESSDLRSRRSACVWVSPACFMTIATLTLPLASRSRPFASSASTPVTMLRMRRARSLSFSEPAWTSTIRLP